MPETLTSSVKVSVAGNLASTIDLGNRGYNVSYNKTINLANGTAANQANNIFTDTRTISASGDDALDLAGILTNALGTTLTFTKIKAIMITAAEGNTNNLVIGGAASNAFATMFGADTDTVIVRPGGVFCIACSDATAYAVTAGTGDILNIANSAGTTSVTYDIVIVGVV